MAEQRRFQFDSDTRSVDVPAGRRRVPWLWIFISLAVHGAIVLFVLAGAARGGHSELVGTLEVTVVGVPSAGDPEGKSNESADATPDTATRPDAPPAPPQAEPLPQPADAKPAEPAAPPPPQPARATPPPGAVPPTRSAVALPPPPNAAAQPDSPPPPPPREQAAIPEAPTVPPNPDGMAKPAVQTAPADPKASPAEVTPPPAKSMKPEIAAAPAMPKAAPDTAEPTQPSAEAAVPDRPVLPETKTALASPARRKAAPAAKATPTAAPSAKPAPAAKPSAEKAAVKQGVKRAAEGQTASLGAPTGGERLGRSENDDSNGVLNINLNPRFRQPPAPPHYPRQSIERDEEGVVLVRAFVDAAGAPQRVRVYRSSGFSMLDEAALKAVRGWRFEPMVRNGRAAASWVQVPVRFRLN